MKISQIENFRTNELTMGLNGNGISGNGLKVDSEGIMDKMAILCKKADFLQPGMNGNGALPEPDMTFCLTEL